MKGERYEPRDSRGDVAGGGYHAHPVVVAPAKASGVPVASAKSGWREISCPAGSPASPAPTMAIELLAGKQNRDGGWPYVRGSSWAEPTAYAVLALLAAGETEPAKRGLRWILAAERPDGGWPPQAGVDRSSWVTALVALLPPEHLGASAHARAI